MFELCDSELCSKRIRRSSSSPFPVFEGKELDEIQQEFYELQQVIAAVRLKVRATNNTFAKGTAADADGDNINVSVLWIFNKFQVHKVNSIAYLYNSIIYYLLFWLTYENIVLTYENINNFYLIILYNVNISL